MTTKVHDVLIIGGGPAGTCTAMFLKKFYGIQSIIVEKEKFPRYHIGESFTGETGGQLRKIDMASALDSQEYPVKIGTKVYGTGGRNSPLAAWPSVPIAPIGAIGGARHQCRASGASPSA